MRIILIWCLLVFAIPVGTFTVGNVIAEYELERTTEEVMDSVIINKYSDRRLVNARYRRYHTRYIVECLGKVDGPGIYFLVSSETYHSVEVGDPLRLAVLYEGDKLYDIRLVERNGNVVSCLNPISKIDLFKWEGDV